MAVLRGGGSAVDAVETAIRVLEDREITNAGYGSNLAIDGVVASNLGVTPRIELEVDDVYQAIVKNGGEFIDDEIGTVWAQALVVQIQGHFFFRGIRTLRDDGGHEDQAPEEREIAAMITIRSHEQRGGERETDRGGGVRRKESWLYTVK